jgi:hypothetical protein
MWLFATILRSRFWHVLLYHLFLRKKKGRRKTRSVKNKLKGVRWREQVNYAVAGVLKRCSLRSRLFMLRHVLKDTALRL